MASTTSGATDVSDAMRMATSLRLGSSMWRSTCAEIGESMWASARATVAGGSSLRALPRSATAEVLQPQERPRDLRVDLGGELLCTFGAVEPGEDALGVVDAAGAGSAGQQLAGEVDQDLLWPRPRDIGGIDGHVGQDRADLVLVHAPQVVRGALWPQRHQEAGDAITVGGKCDGH